jgi:6-phosphogluconolactonase/glucosamine-6-phosphate isomerase/deaminase
VAFLVVFGKEKAHAQGEEMNSEEKKQYPIFGIPPQK